MHKNANMKRRHCSLTSRHLRVDALARCLVDRSKYIPLFGLLLLFDAGAADAEARLLVDTRSEAVVVPSTWENIDEKNDRIRLVPVPVPPALRLF